MKEAIRLSQCMIVKDEEKNIRKALSWGRGIVCEQIVVDTGSTDRTVELAEEMGAKVFHFPWVDDFSAAKNYAIAQASGNWIAFLDADESYSEEDAGKILGILRQIEAEDEERTRIYAVRSALISIDDVGKPIVSFAQDRIFRNLDDLRYHNRIHEALKLSEESKRVWSYYPAETSLTIIHTGYSESTFRDTDKSERNIRLLSKELNEDPKSVRALMYLGESLETAGRAEESEQMFRRALALGPEHMEMNYRNLIFYHLMKNIFTRNLLEEESELQNLYMQAQHWDDTYPDFDYIMGLWYAQREAWEEAIRYLERGLTGLEQYRGMTPLYMVAGLKTVYYVLSNASWALHHPAPTVQYGILCLRIDRYTGEVLKHLLFLLKDDPGEDAQASGTFSILGSLYDFTGWKDQLLVYRCADAVGFYNLAERMKKLMSDEERMMLEGTDE
ncbi:MAG: glycosyltransferase [Hungatella sp.]